MNNISHKRYVNGVEVVDTNPKIVTTYAVPDETMESTSYVILSAKFENDVEMDDREVLTDSVTHSSDEATRVAQEKKLEKITLRGFVETEDGIVPHKHLYMNLDPNQIHEYRTGLQKFSRFL